jgi:hypothetical protein
MYKDQEKMRSTIQAYGALAAQNVNDPRALRDVLIRAYIAGVSPDSVAQSAMTRHSAEQTETMQRAFDRAKSLKMEQLLGLR